MRIAFFTSTFPSRTEVPILNQIAAVAHAGHDVHIFAWDQDEVVPDHEGYHYSDRLTHYHQRLRNTRQGRLRNKWDAFKLAQPHMVSLVQHQPSVLLRLLNVFKYGTHASSFELVLSGSAILDGPSHFDIIHAQFGPNGVLAAKLRDAGVLSGRLLTSFRGYDLFSVPYTRGTSFYELLFQEGEAYTTDTQAMKQHLIVLGAPANRITVLHSGLYPEKFHFAPRTLRSGETVRLISASRLNKSKGIQHGIDAIAELRSRHSELRIEFWIAGIGPYEAELRQRVADHGLDNIHFLGWLSQEELAQAFAKAHIFLLLSFVQEDGYMESQGLALQEAQACGLPVIATNVGGIAEGMIDGVTGQLVHPENPGDVAKAIYELVERADQWPAMGQRGRQFVEEAFSQHQLANDLLTLYKNVHAGR